MAESGAGDDGVSRTVATDVTRKYDDKRRAVAMYERKAKTVEAELEAVIADSLIDIAESLAKLAANDTNRLRREEYPWH